MMNNNQIAYSNMQSFTSPYEVQNMPLGISSFPGYTPMLVNLPFNPNPDMQSMGQMQTMQPLFLQQMPGNNCQPMFQPMPGNCQPMFQPNSPMFLPQMPGNVVIPRMTMDPSLSPPLVSFTPSYTPVTVINPSLSPPPMSQSIPPQTQTAPAKRDNYLGAALRGDRFVSRSRSASIASEDSGDSCYRGRSHSRESGMSESAGPSKRALVDSTLGWMESVFGEKYDNDGTRGENVLRLKVKTVIALQHIIEFIQRCHAEGLIESISCPVSTKKGRQHVRGYLAYIKGFSGASADRIEAIFEAFNQEKGFPFKTLHRNPASTL